jgi:hypothetical protein
VVRELAQGNTAVKYQSQGGYFSGLPEGRSGQLGLR